MTKREVEAKPKPLDPFSPGSIIPSSFKVAVSYRSQTTGPIPATKVQQDTALTPCESGRNCYLASESGYLSPKWGGCEQPWLLSWQHIFCQKGDITGSWAIPSVGPRAPAPVTHRLRLLLHEGANHHWIYGLLWVGLIYRGQFTTVALS